MTIQHPQKSVYHSTFEELRRNNGYYVDKTKEVREAVMYGNALLLRPPQLGKTLLLDTIADLYSGKRELFKGLYIEKNWDWSKIQPILRLDMARLHIPDPGSLKDPVIEALQEFADRYEITTTREKCSASSYLRELLWRLKSRSHKTTVVLIDNYDQPLINFVENGASRKEIESMIRTLRGFYSILKPLSGDEIKFFALTGLTFVPLADALVGGLNNLIDISDSRSTEGICGFSEAELDKYFGEELKGVDRDKLRKWYGGYKWDQTELYSPHDILSFIKTKEFDIYLDPDRTPDFVIKSAVENGYPEVIHRNALDSLSLFQCSPDESSDTLLLFRWGYLAVTGIDRDFMSTYNLRETNLGTECTLAWKIASYIWGKEIFQEKTELLKNALIQEDTEEIETLLKEFFGKLPEDMWSDDYRVYRSLSKRFRALFKTMLFGYLYPTGFEVPYPETADFTKDKMISVTTEKARYLFDIRMRETIKGERRYSSTEREEDRIEEPREWDLPTLQASEKEEGKSLYLTLIEFEENTAKMIEYKTINLTD